MMFNSGTYNILIVGTNIRKGRHPTSLKNETLWDKMLNDVDVLNVLFLPC
jgi:hypothetical protein